MADNLLWFNEIPTDVRDSFVSLGGRKIAIVGFGIKRASGFTPHPNNFRTHPADQKSAVEGSLNTLGWVDVAIENKTTGHLIDGHERIENALSHGDEHVPFLLVELSPAAEAQALLSLDPIAAMAGHSDADVAALLAQIETDNEMVLTHLANMAAEHDKQYPPAELPTSPQQPDKITHDHIIVINTSSKDLDGFSDLLEEINEYKETTVNVS